MQIYTYKDCGVIDDGLSIVGKKEGIILHFTNEIKKQFNELELFSLSSSPIEDTFFNANMVYKMMYEDKTFVDADMWDYLKIDYDNGFGELMVYKVEK